MEAFKIITSTLMVLEMVSLVFSGIKSQKSGKIVSMVMFIILAMGLIAIWG